MSTATARPADDGRAKRPKSRRADIGAAASDLFAARGFHSVRMDDIAQASGITARALYRHYTNKQALLAHVVHSDQARLVDVLTLLGETPPPDLEAGLRALIDAALQSRRLSLLWQREARHLGTDDYAAVRARTRWIADRVAAISIAPAGPGLDPFLTELRSWAVVGLVTSPGHFDTGLSRTRLADLLLQAGLRLVHGSPVASPEDDRQPPVDRSPTSRRELLIRSAAHAFRRHGYGGVGIDEIGREAGVVGPALYRYFDTKADLLVAVVSRFDEWLALESARALRRPVPDGRVIHELVDAYVLLSAQETDVASVSVTERLYLPSDVGERHDRLTGDHVGEWSRWLSLTRPDLSDPEVSVLVNAARTAVDGIVRIPHLRADRRFEPELARLAGDILGVSP
jgi:AcrR family transcriptional regulator